MTDDKAGLELQQGANAGNTTAPQSAVTPPAQEAQHWIAAMPHQERHDLRNYIGQILGYSELWLDRTVETGETELRADLQRIYSAGKQILALINAHVDPIHPRAKYIHAVDAANTGTSTVSRGDHLAHWRMPYVREEFSAILDEPAAVLPFAPDRNAPGGTILLVDDNEANRELLCRRLAQQGHKITLACNGQEALDLLRDHDFDVLLLDIIMPVLNGYETLRHIKVDERLRHLPVIMISALDDLASVIRCIKMGADDYLSKPFDPVLLQARIGACLEKKYLRDREMELFLQLQSNYQQLKELETLRDDLTHMIVHDLRTPLTSLLTGLRTLEYSEHLDGDEQELLGISLSGGGTLLDMINDLLDVGKMEDGSLPLDKQPLQATDLIMHALHLIASLAKDKRLTLEHNIATDLPAFAGDQEKLTRTLVNLLGNAIKFTPPGGTITVSVHTSVHAEGGSKERHSSPCSPSLVFAVHDTGEGIPPDAFERIFEKFGQVESRMAGRKMSTGLGLTFCKLVIEAHEGRLWVESELGQGSTFLFTLPVA
jgi:two-component system, sensor histidine kinase and response regulator